MPAGPEPLIEPIADLAEVRGDWNRLAELTGNVFATWEWAETWLAHLAAGGKPAVAVSRGSDGRVVAVLPLYVARASPLRLVRFLGAGPSDELGPVCAPPDQSVASDALRLHVEATLGGAGLFLGERVRGEHHLDARLGAVTLRRAPSPALPMDGRTFDDYLAGRSRNFRDQVRRRERKLARTHKLVYRLSNDPDRLADDMRVLMRLHEARWSKGRSSAFSGARAGFHLEFARRALERRWLRLWTMELDGRPVAAWYGLRFAGVDFYYQAGRDPALDRLNVGFVLLCHTIRAAFDDGMREYRFGLGGEAYKDRFSEVDPGLETIAIPAGIRGRLALSGLSAGLHTQDRARPVLRRWRTAGVEVRQRLGTRARARGHG